MSDVHLPSDEWLGSVDEEVIDPDRPIVDPHHHLWPVGGPSPLPYGLPELTADVRSGHHVDKTVFVECGAAYRTDGPAHLVPVGETAFVGQTAANDPNKLIAGIVAHADLRRDDLDEILDAHVDAGHGYFRGIRDALSRAEHPDASMIPGQAPKDLYADASFRRGVRRLGQRGFTYDTWHYHYQIPEMLGLARAVPDTVMVLDHFGTPLGVGPYADQREQIFDAWRRDITELAGCANVVAKLGGMAMPDNGFGWDTADRPPTSDDIVAAQSRYYLHTIEAFGPERCMFESNFPVDKFSLSYRVLWNAFKKIAADFSDDEKTALFSGTATGVYRL